MADPPASPESGGDTGEDPGTGSTTGTPRWVKVLGFIALVLILLFVILHFTVGGLRDHTPSVEHGVRRP